MDDKNKLSEIETKHQKIIENKELNLLKYLNKLKVIWNPIGKLLDYTTLICLDLKTN